MRSLKLSSLLISALLFCNTSASAVEFSECEKFAKKDTHKYLKCAGYSFTEATQKSEYPKIRQWLNTHNQERKHFYNELLANLMCGPVMSRGGKPFKATDQQAIITLTDQLLDLGASFNSMPSFAIVTPLFCATNRKDSVILDHILTRTNARTKNLDASLYEGSSPEHVPLVRAVMNNDLASAEVLIKHGATLDFSLFDNETALKKALELGNIDAANWLLDKGASVHNIGNGRGCSDKSILDYALEISSTTQGRAELIKRIEALSRLPFKHESETVCTN